MAEALVTAFRPIVGRPHPLAEVVLLPSHGGRFEVTADDKLIFSKLATHEHTTNEYVIGQVRELLGKA